MCITEYNEAETMQMIREEGREEGRKEGRKEGREEGREEGDRKRAMKTAYNMRKDGEPIDKIARFLEVSPEMILAWVEKI